MEKKFLEKVMLFWPGEMLDGLRFFSKQAAFSPEDFKKMKFFAWGAEAEQQEIMKSLGYTPGPANQRTSCLPFKRA
jgi:hypothetical protein